MNIAKMMVIIIIVSILFIISTCLYCMIRYYSNKVHNETQQMAVNHIFNDIYNNRNVTPSAKIKNTPQEILEENPEIVKEQLPQVGRGFIMV